MSYKRAEGQEPTSYQALLDEIQALKDENQRLRERMAESEELKQAEEAMRKSESRYRMLFTSMTEGFGLVEVIYKNYGKPYDYRYLEINPAFELYLGIKREQLLGKTMRETFPNVSSIALEKYNEVALSGQPTHFEIFSKIANRYLDIYVFILEKGKIALILRDITERKKTEDALQQAYEEFQLKSEELQASNEELHAQSEELQAQTEELQVQSEELQAQTEELQNAYQELSNSEKRYRMLFTNMTEGFFIGEPICDKDGKPYDYLTLEVNPAYERHLGVKKELVLGKSILEVDPNSSPIAIKNYGEVALTGKPNNFEVFSKVVNRHLDFYAFSPEKGKFAVIFRDINDRKKAEEALRESRAKLKAAIESMTDAVFISDVEGNFVDFNDSFVKFHRFHSKEECYRKLFKYYLDIFEGYSQDGTLASTDMWPVRRALRGETATDAELIVRRKDTGETWIASYSFAPIRDKDGMIVGSVVVARDITKRKRIEEELYKAYKKVQTQSEELQAQNEELQAQSEELHEANEALHESEDQFRALINNVKYGVVLVDETGRFAVVNPSFMQMFGLDNKLDIRNINSQDWGRWEVYGEDGKLLHVDDHPVRKVELTGNPVKDQLVAVRNPGANKLTWMLISAEPILKEDGHIYRVICTYHDITERKKAEDKLKEILDNLDKLVKERTAELEKAYNSLKEIETARKQEIHHRIKNNLQVISSLLDLQAEQFRDKECIKDSEVLEAFRESQDRVISMALIHEELYRGGGFETLNFTPYIEELAKNLFQTYSLGNTKISLKMGLAENAFFDMDVAVPLGMIVNELVSNSFKHAFVGRDEGEIRIKLCREEYSELESKDCEGSNFVLTVSDNGIGIPENLDIEDIDSLGMQLVTTLVDQLDGEFEIKRDNGTEFTMRFIVKENKNPTSMPALQLIE